MGRKDHGMDPITGVRQVMEETQQLDMNVYVPCLHTRCADVHDVISPHKEPTCPDVVSCSRFVLQNHRTVSMIFIIIL